MPELPDLVYIVQTLQATLTGASVSRLLVKQPVVLRMLLPEDELMQALSGAKLRTIVRHGPFLCFSFDKNVEMIIHPMLAGKFKVARAGEAAGRGLCFSLSFDDGQVLHYLDDKKMGKVYFTRHHAKDTIPRFRQQGIDILSADFTLGTFRSLLHKQRKQVRVFLMTQELLSAIGNAYADEILFHAHLHPKTFCHQLSSEQVKTLYHSIGHVMQWGIQAVKTAAQPLQVKVRNHMKVRNRKGEPCPACGAAIRTTGVLGHDAFFCPKCQPAQRDFLIDWSATPKPNINDQSDDKK